MFLFAFLLIGCAAAQSGYPTITVKDQQRGKKGGSVSIEFSLESSEQSLDQSQVHIVKASKDHKFSQARFQVKLEGSGSKISGTASADNLVCDDQSAYLIYYQRIPPPPKKGPPPGSFMMVVTGCPKPPRPPRA